MPADPSQTSSNSSHEELPPVIHSGHTGEDGREDKAPKDYAEYGSSGKGLKSNARLMKNGRINICLHLKHKLPDLSPDYANDVHEFAVDDSSASTIPPLNIVVMIVGSRGDVQPYLALGRKLAEYGHRVRIATHETFNSFVRDAGLEFFSIGGDPHDLMSYMVKNPGLIPGFESLTNGDIGRKRKMLNEILEGCWAACHTKDEMTGKPFIADAIISNPPAFAHIHCAQALGVPLQMSFTMPWSPTSVFPHPLVNVSQSNAEPRLTNYLSYAMAEMLTWQGLSDLINDLRKDRLHLFPMSSRAGAGVIDRLRVPWTYCWSPEIIPKPFDWTNHIDIVGFYFLDLASNYTPPVDLAAFLDGGPPPIYIGFGSVVVPDPVAMTQTIFDAVEKAGVRAVVSAGWGGLGGTSIPSNIFIIQNVPHDWLFNHVSAVCHHGGAGTTAIGLRLGKPTIIVPFFGDQPFWGAMVWRSGAGPKPIDHESLTVEGLTEAIRFVGTPEAQKAAERLGELIRKEDGASEGVLSFHKHLPILNMRCDLDPSRLSVWWCNDQCLRLSAFAAQVLVDSGLVDWSKLELHRMKEYDTFAEATDPIIGGAVELLRTMTHFTIGLAQLFTDPKKGLINTATSIPIGMSNIMLSIGDGLHNTPKLYGSEVRTRGKVTDVSSGFAEAGKELAYGFYDGITGLWQDPIKGAKKDGWVGGVYGTIQGLTNLVLKPSAGAFALVSQPTRGIWKSYQNHVDRGRRKQIKEIRIWEGTEAIKASTAEERQLILERFEKAKAQVKQRKKELARAAKKIMEQTGGAVVVTDADAADVGDHSPGSVSPKSTTSSVSRTSSHTESATRSPKLPVKRVVHAPPYTGRTLREEQEEQEEAQFARDIDRALKLSLGEQEQNGMNREAENEGGHVKE